MRKSGKEYDDGDDGEEEEEEENEGKKLSISMLEFWWGDAEVERSARRKQTLFVGFLFTVFLTFIHSFYQFEKLSCNNLISLSTMFSPFTLRRRHRFFSFLPLFSFSLIGCSKVILLSSHHWAHRITEHENGKLISLKNFKIKMTDLETQRHTALQNIPP